MVQVSILQTDLYQLTMMAAYFREGMNPTSTFELFVRKLPPNRSYLIFAGLEEALEVLEDLHFSTKEIDYLQSLPSFAHIDKSFFEALRNFRFEGEIWAAKEGEVVFAGEPLLRVTAPLLEAQLIETMLLSVINMSTMIASKAARVVSAAQGRDVVEFGTRRAHGPEAGLLAARSSYIAGCVGTSNVEAGHRYGIPVVGTCAHSFIMSFAKEEDAFRSYAAAFPEHATLLIDTYDTLQGAHLAAKATPKLRGVRLDSGDLATLSKKVRVILDQEGQPDAKIVASNDLNEEKIAQLLKEGAPIDIFGVGTELATSKDAPALGGVYKLVAQEDAPGHVRYVLKNSPGKPSYPGAKQLYRFYSDEGHAKHDLITLAEEHPPQGSEALLSCVMRDGKRTRPAPTLQEIQAYSKSTLARFPQELRELASELHYPVQRSAKIDEARQVALDAMPKSMD
ncbi:MAG: nicotinate phosphoribosyltransferase [Myxococcales bacterium]|nr:nicotinate phosphoribosyltransferase [Myxococcales bacterium]MCB9644755.1 nicotinate phosphoribosyltransferase [Myxococcales bacterium]